MDLLRCARFWGFSAWNNGDVMRIVELDNENQGIGATSNCGSHEDAMQFLLMYHDAFHSNN